MGLITSISASLGLAALLIAAGCGGGQTGSGAGSPASQTSKTGNAVFTYFGNPKPLLATSSGIVSVLGQAGATFSNVTLEPPPNLNDTYLAIGRSVGSEGQIYKSSYANPGSEQLLYDGDELVILPTISAYGTVAFSVLGPTAFYLESIREDGTGLTPINFTGVTNDYPARYSEDGTNRLAFVAGPSLYIGPGTGGTPTLVQSNSYAPGGVCWNPTGTKLAYAVAVGTSGNTDIFTTSTSGGTPVDVTPTSLKNTAIFGIEGWSPDGVTILAKLGTVDDENGQMVTFSTNNPSNYNIISASNNDAFAAFSPDGTAIALERTAETGVLPGVYLCDAAGLNQTLVLPDPTGSSANYGISWSPFLPKETVVAASASTFYHQAASGFLLSQNGSQFGSMVAFTAATPSSASVQAPSNTSSGAPLIFTITADSITSIGYINNYFSAGTTVSLSSAPAVVVSVDASTGQVDLVAPAATGKPAISKNPDGSVTCSAKFSAIYDGHGKNLAPGGASKLVTDPKTGQLVSFR